MTAEWNLQDILKEEDIPTIIDELRGRVEALANKKEEFSSSMSAESFKEAMQELEIIERALGKVATYAHCKFSVDTQDQKTQALVNKVRSLGAEIEEKLLFINQEWKRFGEEDAERLIKAAPEYEHHLRVVRAGKKHMLSDEVERIITIKDVNGAGALEKIYDTITSEFTYEFRGEELTQGELQEHLKSPDASARKEAYETLLKKYGDHEAVLGALYQHIADDWRREAALRSYESPISVRNHVNDIPDEAISALLEVCRENKGVWHEYFKKKAQLLGKDELERYDLYAPLEEEKEKISYEEAVEKVLAIFKEFHPAFHDCAKKIIDEGHIHAKTQRGKRGGAYCTGVSPDTTPYVFLSYNGTIENVETLIHELGHGIHFSLSSKQNVFHYDAALPIAETASIFSEALLMARLKEENPGSAQAMMAGQLDRLYASISRQAWFTIFEETAHEMVRESPSTDELSAAWYEQLEEQFGPVKIPKIFAKEWLYIPHIYHSPFYCYAYAFGCLLSLAFYKAYQEDEAFAQKIVTFLESGSAKSPYELVKETGFDITKKEFWQKGFDVIEEMVDSL